MSTRYICIKNHGTFKDMKCGKETIAVKIIKKWECTVNNEPVGTLYSTQWGYIAFKLDGTQSCYHIGMWKQVSAVIANFCVGRVGFGYNRP